MKKKLIAFFTNRIVISLIGLLALSLLVWFAGPHVKFGDDNTAPLGGTVARLVTIMVLLLLWGLNNLRIQMRNKKQNEDLVEDLEENDEQARRNAGPDQSAEELQQINQRFVQALNTLKKLKFKGIGSRSKALYELPWYIIIGPPGSGKTTALVNSSLEFPLAEQFGKGALQGVGGTRNCDWWFTNEAVLIDTAGRYTTQDSHRVVDSSAWEGFLNLLKKNRPRRPINGAIIAISLQDLLTQTEEERMMHAKIIRSRIDELMDKLQVRFPIYLMFTKADLVSGFTEFFEDLGREEREQVWGVSLPNAPKPSQSPDFDYMQEQFDGLLERLYERVLHRMHQERDPRRRGAIQGFPQQIENLKPMVTAFVRQTFAKNRYQFQPYLRGVYLSSGTQDGTPIDRLMSSVASSFGFDASVGQLPQQRGKSFFLGRLFREVIFPESELVGSNRRYETIMLWAKRAAYAGMAGVAIVMVLVWGGSVTRHEMFMGDVRAEIAEYNQSAGRLSAWNRDIRTVLPPLNALANASIVYDQEKHPWLSGLGLFDPRVDSAADDAYAAKLRELLLPRLFEQMEERLRQGHRGGDLYNTFRVYMMFKKTDHMDKPLVVDWFKNRWSQQLHGEATRREQLLSHLKALLELDLDRAELDARLVENTRQLLLRVPVSKRIYSRIRTNPDYTQEVNLLNLAGESVRNAYNIDARATEALSMPALFTKQGYESLEFSPDSPVIADVVNERWIFSDEENAKVDFVEEDLDEISKKVKQHYLAEYAQVWTDALESLRVAQLTSLSHANEVLSNFTDPVYSPLVSVLELTRENTQLTAPMLANAADDHEGSKTGKVAGFLAGKQDWTVVDKRFRDLHVLLRESGGRAAPITSIMQKIGQLQSFMYEISVAPDPGKKSFQVAAGRYQSGSGNAVTQLKLFAKNIPEPVSGWLTDLADQSWKIVLQTAHGHVNAEWRTQVYEPYRRGLAGRYPLNASASQELAVFDFTEFFKPGGTVDKFAQKYVTPFVDTRQGWTNRSIDGYSMGFSSSVLTQLRKAEQIKQIFFSGNPQSPSIAFQVKPHEMDKSDVRFLIELGNERVSYNHGPKFWSNLSWSGADSASRVRIAFEDVRDKRHFKTYEGPWGWFRLLDDSRIRSTRSSNVFLVTFTVMETARAPGGRTREVPHTVTYQIKAKSVNNPFSKNLLGAFRLPESI